MTKHVHVVNTHGLGDVVMILPMLREIDQDGHKISITVKSKIEAQLVGELFRPNTAPIVFLFYQEYKNQGTIGLFKYVYQLYKLKADLIFPAINVSKVHYNLLSFFSFAKFRVGHGGLFSFLNHHNWQETPFKHKVELNCDLYREIQLYWGHQNKKNKLKPQFPSFHPNKDVLSQLKKKFPIISADNLIGLAPGSGALEKHKRWPIKKYAELAVDLIHNGYAVVVIGGPGEEMLGSVISRHVGETTAFVDLTGKLSVPETVHFVSQLDTIIVNCNGISHIASVLDINIIGIYGPTNPYHTGSYSQKLEVISNNLECAPCYKRGFTKGCGKPRCMSDIMTSYVLSKLT